MIDMPKRWWSNAAGVMSFMITGFCLLVIYDTMFSYPGGNVTVEPVVAIHGWNNQIGLAVQYERAFTIHETDDGEVQRIIKCPPVGEESYFLETEPQRRTFTAGRYPPSKRPLQFASPVPVGTECVLEVWGVWCKRFAISSTRFKIDEMIFTVQAHAPK